MTLRTCFLLASLILSSFSATAPAYGQGSTGPTYPVDIYFGAVDRDRGMWALGANTEFHFVAFLREERKLLESDPYWYSVFPDPLKPSGPNFWGPGFAGNLLPSGEVAGAVNDGPGPAIPFSGRADAPTGATNSRFQGSYWWYDPLTTLLGRRAHAFVGPSGKAMLFVQDADQGGADCGVGTIGDDGAFNVAFAFGTRVTARIDPARGLIVESPYRPAPDYSKAAKSDSRVINVSVRGRYTSVRLDLAANGERVLLRSIGPGLARFLPAGSANVDPALDVLLDSGLRLENEDWESTVALTEAFRQTGAFPIDVGSRDAALIATLGATNLVRSRTRDGGMNLSEVFTLGSAPTSRVIGCTVMSATAGPADSVILGITIAGTEAKTLLIRGLGPALARAPFNQVSFDPDTSLVVHDATGRILAENDDWPSSLVGVFQQLGASEFVRGSKDAALLLTLGPGAYTVVLRGAGHNQNALVFTALEMFEVPR